MYKSNPQTEYRTELRKRILKTAIQEFRSKGIKAVKMDDIASMLSVSKRTLYEIYDNKEQLLMECVEEEYNGQMRHITEFAQDPQHSVMDVILEFYRFQMQNLRHMSPVYYTELHRYPSIIGWLQEMRTQNQEKTQIFHNQTVQEGYFRADVNYELISRIGAETADYLMSTQILKQYKLEEIFRNVVMLFIRGLCTKKGIDKLEEVMKKI